MEVITYCLKGARWSLGAQPSVVLAMESAVDSVDWDIGHQMWNLTKLTLNQRETEHQMLSYR